MALPLPGEVHVLFRGTSSGGVAPGSTPRPARDTTGVTSSFSATQVIQTVYYCTPSTQALQVVFLDVATRTVYTAQPTEATPVVGVVMRKNSATTAVVVAYGPVDGFMNLTPGTRYFLGADGTLLEPPIWPEMAPYVHPVGQAITDTVLFVMPQWPQLKRDRSDR